MPCILGISDKCKTEEKEDTVCDPCLDYAIKEIGLGFCNWRNYNREDNCWWQYCYYSCDEDLVRGHMLKAYHEKDKAKPKHRCYFIDRFSK